MVCNEPGCLLHLWINNSSVFVTDINGWIIRFSLISWMRLNFTRTIIQPWTSLHSWDIFFCFGGLFLPLPPSPHSYLYVCIFSLISSAEVARSSTLCLIFHAATSRAISKELTMANNQEYTSSLAKSLIKGNQRSQKGKELAHSPGAALLIASPI